MAKALISNYIDKPKKRRPGVHAKTKRTFTQSDIGFLKIAANTLAQAIKHKHTEQILQQRTRELEMLCSASHFLVSTLDFDQILVNILEYLKVLTNN